MTEAKVEFSWRKALNRSGKLRIGSTDSAPEPSCRLCGRVDDRRRSPTRGRASQRDRALGRDRRSASDRAEADGPTRRRGPVSSVRGASGGFALAQARDEISLADIVEAVEGPIALTMCSEAENHDCILDAHCRVKPHIGRGR